MLILLEKLRKCEIVSYPQNTQIPTLPTIKISTILIISLYFIPNCFTSSKTLSAVFLTKITYFFIYAIFQFLAIFQSSSSPKPSATLKIFSCPLSKFVQHYQLQIAINSTSTIFLIQSISTIMSERSHTKEVVF